MLLRVHHKREERERKLQGIMKSWSMWEIVCLA